VTICKSCELLVIWKWGGGHGLEWSGSELEQVACFVNAVMNVRIREFVD